MNTRTIHSQVARLFRPLYTGGTRTVRAAVEQEYFAVDFYNGSAVDPQRVRQAVAGRSYAEWVSFEPGGQVELSLPCASSTAAAADHLVEVTRALAADLLGQGIVLYAQPVRACEPTTSRFLRSPRYDAMEQHFDSIGPAGRRMMRHTTSTQVCLDWWPGRAGLEQWRLLLLAGPFIAAATARSAGPTGRLTTWLAADPDRTAFDDRLLQGDPVAAYASFAAGATDFVGGTVADHLSTLFPPVRPRGGYLEIRFPDAQTNQGAGVLLEGLAGLLYDDERRRTALASVAGEQSRLAEHWAATAAGTGDAERGLALLGAGVRSLEVAA